MAARSPGRVPAVVALVLVTIASALAVTLGLRLEPNVASLLPERGEAAALRRYVRGFGGGDLAVIMVKGTTPTRTRRPPRRSPRRSLPRPA